jgi:hypothetical protein
VGAKYFALIRFSNCVEVIGPTVVWGTQHSVSFKLGVL